MHKALLEHSTAVPIRCHIVIGCFPAIVAAELLPTNSTMFTIWPFTEKVCRSLSPPKCYQWSTQYQKYECKSQRENFGHLKKLRPTVIWLIQWWSFWRPRKNPKITWYYLICHHLMCLMKKIRNVPILPIKSNKRQHHIIKLTDNHRHCGKH